MTQDIALFKAISAKMGYLDARHKVLAQNVANADTPDYRAQDISEPDFGHVLKDITDGSRLHVRVNTTDEGHIPAPGDIEEGDQGKRKVTYEVAPAGNAVILEEEVIKASQNTMDYNTMTNLYAKMGSMMKTALGKG